MKTGEFYNKVLRTAFSLGLAFFGVSWGKLKYLILLYVVTAAAAYFFFGEVLTIKQLAVPVFLLFPLVFLFCCVIAPVKICSDYKNSWDKAEELLSEICNREKFLRKLMEKYSRGCEVYDEVYQSPPDTKWFQRMEEWSKEVEEYLHGNFSIKDVHTFKKVGDSISHRGMLQFSYTVENDLREKLSSFSFKLLAISDIIDNFNFLSIGQKILDRYKENRKEKNDEKAFEIDFSSVVKKSQKRPEILSQQEEGEN